VLNADQLPIRVVSKRRDIEGGVCGGEHLMAGDLLTLTDQNTNITTWNYDEYGRATNKVDASATVVFKFGYDANGWLTHRWTPAKLDTFYTNDAVGNVTFINYLNSDDVSLGYDAVNRLTSISNALGMTYRTYTQFGALATEDGPWDNDTISYGYTQNRSRQNLSLQQPNASAWAQSYAYDRANRLTNTTSPAGVFGYQYLAAASVISKLVLPNAAYITNSYDTSARILSTVLKNSTNGILNSHAYAYNVGSQRTALTNVSGEYLSYGYDSIGQLKTALGKESGGSTRLHEILGYNYDPAGNVKHRTNNALIQTFTVNNRNQLTAGSRSGSLSVAGTTTSTATNVTVNTSNATLYADNTFASTNHALVDGTNAFTAIGLDSYGRADTNTISTYLPASPSFSYDSNGNLVYDGQRAFGYDDENRLASVTRTNHWKSEFTYDGLSRRRVRKEYFWQNSAWVLSNEVRYVYDGARIIQERNSWNLPQLAYTRGSDLSGTLEDAGGIGGLLAISQLTFIAPQHAYYHADGNGNVTMLINTQQLAVARYRYEPFGALLSLSGPWAELNRFRFSSKEEHLNSGLVLYEARAYEALLQRWPNRDPIEEEGGLNLYACLRNDPINRVDPLGLFWTGQPYSMMWGGAGSVSINGKTYVVTTKTQFVVALKQATAGAEKIHTITYYGHGDPDAGGLLWAANKDPVDTLGYISPQDLKNYLEYFKDLFDPKVRVKLKSCGSANPNVFNSADAFKSVFPQSKVSGYTGLYLPYVGGVPNWPYFTHGESFPNTPKSSSWITK
jgi:RHS repeat-associated protein